MLSVGFGELLGACVVLFGAGWALLKLIFMQFETRINEKFEVQEKSQQRVELLTIEIKRLELEMTKRDAIYIPRNEFQSATDKIFEMLRDIKNDVSNMAIEHSKGK